MLTFQGYIFICTSNPPLPPAPLPPSYYNSKTPLSIEMKLGTTKQNVLAIFSGENQIPL